MTDHRFSLGGDDVGSDFGGAGDVEAGMGHFLAHNTIWATCSRRFRGTCGRDDIVIGL